MPRKNKGPPVSTIPNFPPAAVEINQEFIDELERAGKVKLSKKCIQEISECLGAYRGLETIKGDVPFPKDIIKELNGVKKATTALGKALRQLRDGKLSPQISAYIALHDQWLG